MVNVPGITIHHPELYDRKSLSATLAAGRLFLIILHWRETFSKSNKVNMDYEERTKSDHLTSGPSWAGKVTCKTLPELQRVVRKTNESPQQSCEQTKPLCQCQEESSINDPEMEPEISGEEAEVATDGE